MITILTCLSLTVVDGDTPKCDGQNLRMLGDGAPYVSGIDTPEIGQHADCELERRMGLAASARLRAYIEAGGITVEDTGVLDRYDRPLVHLRLCHDSGKGFGSGPLDFYINYP